MQRFGNEESICRLTYYCCAGLGDTCIQAWGVCECCRAADFQASGMSQCSACDENVTMRVELD